MRVLAGMVDSSAGVSAGRASVIAAGWATAAGRRVWGFANDDAHAVADQGVAWNVVQADARKPASIMRALREGRFYASTGVGISAIRVEGATVRVDTADGQRCRVFSELGRLQATAEGPSITFEVPEDFPFRYIRIEC